MNAGKMKKIIREAQLLIIDEISMFAVQQFKFLNLRFQEFEETVVSLEILTVYDYLPGHNFELYNEVCRSG